MESFAASVCARLADKQANQAPLPTKGSSLPNQKVMTTRTAMPVPKEIDRATRVRRVGWAVAAAGAALSWPGGLMGLAGVVVALAGLALALRLPAAAGQPTASDAPTQQARPAALARQAIAQASGRGGTDLMVSTVVPVWSRQLEVTREAAADGLSNILEHFSQMSNSLQTLVDDIQSCAVQAEPGAVDQAVRRESPALDALLAASRRAFDQRDAVVGQLGRCADALAELQQLAKQTREIARHTRLVAFNASIEANRGRTGSQADSGSQAVATELRNVATRMAEAGERVDQVVAALLGDIRKARREGEIGDCSDEELRLELDLKAREALSALLGGLGSSLQGSQTVQQASRELQDQLEAVFVNFQFGDRVSQMLSIVGNDMDHFTRWVADNPGATAADAASWLAALEASYTMDEQRSTHHGNVVVDKSAGVEFF